MCGWSTVTQPGVNYSFSRWLLLGQHLLHTTCMLTRVYTRSLGARAASLLLAPHRLQTFVALSAPAPTVMA